MRGGELKVKSKSHSQKVRSGQVKSGQDSSERPVMSSEKYEKLFMVVTAKVSQGRSLNKESQKVKSKSRVEASSQESVKVKVRNRWNI